MLFRSKDKQPEMVLLNSDLKISEPLPPAEVATPVTQVQAEEISSAAVVAKDVNVNAGTEAASSKSDQGVRLPEFPALTEEKLLIADQPSSSEITPAASVDLTTASPSVAESSIPPQVEEETGLRRETSNRDSSSLDRKSTRLNSSHIQKSRMPSSA